MGTAVVATQLKQEGHNLRIYYWYVLYIEANLFYLLIILFDGSGDINFSSSSPSTLLHRRASRWILYDDFVGVLVVYQDTYYTGLYKREKPILNATCTFM